MSPFSMRAVTIAGGKGPATALRVEQVAKPEPRPGELLLRVRAAGVNRPDIVQREGRYPPPPGAPGILGLEAAGEVVAAGTNVERWKVGDRVTALLPGGGYAEFATVDGRHALPLPAGLDFIQAAALPETVFTVWSNVFERGALRAGETLLVHGANSGIGVTAIQMAKAAGARVIATARGPKKADQARRVGADLAIDTTLADWAGEARSAGGADVVLDMVGADFFAANVELLKADGRLVVIATMSGHKVEVDLRFLMTKRLTVTASTLRARDADEKARLARAVEERVWPWVEAGRVRPIVDRTFPLEDAAEAHRWLELGAQFGKVVLTFDER
jgi:putative PIG3 family NAD(P)H quinone oxidoreductase